MNNQVIFSDSKAATFHDECVSLTRQIEVQLMQLLSIHH